MNIEQIKKFAPSARRKLIDAVRKRAAEFGIYEDQILEPQSSTGDSITINGKVYGKVAKLQRSILVNKIKSYGRDGFLHVVEEVAYTWFNRFCALRCLEVNNYLEYDIKIVSTLNPMATSVKSLKAFNLDPETVKQLTDNLELEALWKLQILAQCHALHKQMPFLFEDVNDFTELLFPSDLTHSDSVLSDLVNVIDEESWKHVEVIGWLYQFYILEKKNIVFEGLKSNQKINAESLPAATQLFTPKWIVKYLVENSIGRLWMLNNKDSHILNLMGFYINPEDKENSFVSILGPEEIRIIDPACGSGHILVSAFDLLYEIYMERGYSCEEAIDCIINKNLYGAEVDARAAELAAFAITLKAREKDRKFFNRNISPKILTFVDVNISQEDIENFCEACDLEQHKQDILNVSVLVKEASLFGSLMNFGSVDFHKLRDALIKVELPQDMFLSAIYEKLYLAMEQVLMLHRGYHVVITNPPYADKGNLVTELVKFSKDFYKDTRQNLYSMFMARSLDMLLDKGYLSMVTMEGWMLLSSYEKARSSFFKKAEVLSLLHIGAKGFDSIEGEVVSTAAFVLEKDQNPGTYNGQYFDLTEGKSESEKVILLNEINKERGINYYRSNTSKFSRIPTLSMGYWLGDETVEIFENSDLINDVATPRAGMSTGNNKKYVRCWWEVNRNNIGTDFENRSDAKESNLKWFFYLKGGDYRKWYGNYVDVVDWYEDGFNIKTEKAANLRAGKITANNSKCWNQEFYFRPSVSWNKVSTSNFGCRINEAGFISSDASNGIYGDEQLLKCICVLLNSKVAKFFLRLFSPTINFQSGDLGRIPYVPFQDINEDLERIVQIHKNDWDSKELSFDFKTNTLLKKNEGNNSLETILANSIKNDVESINEARKIEEGFNDYLIKLYHLDGLLDKFVDFSDITLFSNNSVYSEKAEKSFYEFRKNQYLVDLISFSVGCMFGRFATDEEGFVEYSNIENKIQELRLSKASSVVVKDNIIPVLDDDWFEGDIYLLFKKFIKSAFGSDFYSENIKTIESGIGSPIRKYFLKSFYKDHVKMYQKKPIYWLFSSPKGYFSALVYVHKYNKDLIGQLRRDYLHEYQNKLERAESNLIDGGSKRELSNIRKALDDIRSYDETLKHASNMQLEINLDDGIKVNYQKFYDLGLVAKI